MIWASSLTLLIVAFFVVGRLLTVDKNKLPASAGSGVALIGDPGTEFFVGDTLLNGSSVVVPWEDVQRLAEAYAESHQTNHAVPVEWLNNAKGIRLIVQAALGKTADIVWAERMDGLTAGGYRVVLVEAFAEQGSTILDPVAILVVKIPNATASEVAYVLPVRSRVAGYPHSVLRPQPGSAAASSTAGAFLGTSAGRVVFKWIFDEGPLPPAVARLGGNRLLLRPVR